MTDHPAGFRPALAYQALSPLCDQTLTLTACERALKPARAAQASIHHVEPLLAPTGCASAAILGDTVSHIGAWHASQPRNRVD